MENKLVSVASLSARKLAFLFVAIAATARGQSVRSQQQQPTGGLATATQASATVADSPPTIDGKDDDAVWTNATPITGFRVFDPAEDGEPSFKTEAKIGYDAENIYVFARMFDPKH